MINYPNIIFLKFFAEALPAPALAYGLVWLVMRPKGGKRIDNPLLWHACGIAITLVASAVFRTIAMVTFAGRDAYEPSVATGAAGFYLLIVPALLAAAYFMWIKKDKLSASHGESTQSASLGLPTSPAITADQSSMAINIAPGNKQANKTSSASKKLAVPTPQSFLESPKLDVDDDAIYAVIAKELETGATDLGLWTRLLAECDGDEKKTKVAYIKRRAEKIAAMESGGRFRS